MSERFVDKVLLHELGSTADFKIRSRFYDEIVNLQRMEKLELSRQLVKNIPGCKFEAVAGKSFLDGDFSEDNLKLFIKDGYTFPFKVPKQLVFDIYDIIKPLSFHNTWRNVSIKGEDFIGGDNKILQSNNFQGTYWLTESQQSYSNLIDNSLLQDIAFDPNILNLVSQYLGTTPIHVATNIWFSSPSNDVEEQKKSAQQFHQDAGFTNFVKVFIYLTDTNSSNGAHCFIRGSHAINPREIIPHYVTSKRYTDNELEGVYGEKNLITIGGNVGDVIFGDTSCFHKGGVVTKGVRLMMNLEYASSLFGAGMNYFNVKEPFSPKLGGYSEIVRKRLVQNYNPQKYQKESYIKKTYQLMKHKTIVSVKNLIGK